MYVTNTAGCSSGGSWEAYATSKAWTLAQTQGTATVYVAYKDDAGNVSSCINDTIIHDSLAPTSASVSINAGASFTSEAEVTLNLSATDASPMEMYITNTAGCGSGGSWEAYSATKTWTIVQDDVYVKFRDAQGYTSGCVSDTIDFRILALGNWHSCIRMRDGTVKCWVGCNDNGYGECGLGPIGSLGDGANEMGPTCRPLISARAARS